jgi:hypothetical protein
MEAHGGSTLAPAHGRRAWAAFIVLLVPLVCGASHRTTNFMIEAPTAEIARKVAESAEACRASIAREWLGEELPPWSTPCPVRVKLTRGEAGGLTSFGFDHGRVTEQDMMVEGRLERILASALPHEVTHTVFAAHLGGPMPRWADEGASLLSEDLRERRRQDKIAEDLLRRRGDLPLSRLFIIEEYPKDLLGFYGQGYSISRFLIEIGGRPRFLRFVREGTGSGWDTATRNQYGLANVRELDRAWRAWHRVLAQTQGQAPAGANGGAGTVVVRAPSVASTEPGPARRVAARRPE